MAKKYLLYIHDSDRFGEEMYKSELVNKLLEIHYSQHLPGDYIAPIEDIEVLKKDFPKVIKTSKEAREAIDTMFKTETWRQCKNGHAIPAFQNKCLGKGCKYA